MTTYAYQALNTKGRRQSGTLEADSPRQARQQLRGQGLSPLCVEEAAQQVQRTADAPKTFTLFKRGIKTTDLSLITRQLATMIAAAMPIEECLKAVAEQCEKKVLRTILSAVRNRVIEGYTLADSMSAFPHIFDTLYCAMIAAGERSGHLDTVLNRLADYVEQRKKLQSKLLQAMIYPVILTIIAITVVSILLGSVVPQVIEQFIHMKQELPLITQILIKMSAFVKNFGLSIALIIALAFLGLHFWLRHPKNLKKYHHFLLKMPIIGRVSRGLNTARYARTLSILNASAVPLLEAMTISSRVLTNTYARDLLTKAADKVREGSSIRVALETTHLFPPMMLYMIASGEQSGELDAMLERAAENQDREFEAQVNIALGIFQPALVVCMAAVVLFIAVAMLKPILQLNNLVGL